MPWSGSVAGTIALHAHLLRVASRLISWRLAANHRRVVAVLDPCRTPTVSDTARLAPMAERHTGWCRFRGHWSLHLATGERVEQLAARDRPAVEQDALDRAVALLLDRHRVLHGSARSRGSVRVCPFDSCDLVASEPLTSRLLVARLVRGHRSLRRSRCHDLKGRLRRLASTSFRDVLVFSHVIADRPRVDGRASVPLMKRMAWPMLCR